MRRQCKGRKAGGGKETKEEAFMAIWKYNSRWELQMSLG